MSTKQRYRVLEKIDSGGMAEIFKAHAISLDGIQKVVAIKRVRPHLATNMKFIKMFIDEARLSMRLNHANITQVFDVGRANDTYFLVMEFVDGANLRRLMQLAEQRGYRIPVQNSIYIIIELCKALSHAHQSKDEDGESLGIVHRDVSPPNILVSRNGEVKITDFGLAKAVTHLESTDPGVVKGKFSYLSPEAAEGKGVDARADIFSCGIVLHEFLSGRRLFMGKTDLDTVELVRKCEIPPPSSFNSDVDRDLDAVVLRALEKDRRKRFQSAGDMANALAEYLFSHNLKVTTFDVAHMMQEMLDDQTVIAPPERVVDMIREEIINLSSVGKLPGLMPVEGSQPIDVTDFKGRRSPFEDIWHDYENAGEDTSSASKLIKLTEGDGGKKDKKRKENEKGKKGRDQRPQGEKDAEKRFPMGWVVAGGAILALVAVAAWLFYANII